MEQTYSSNCGQSELMPPAPMVPRRKFSDTISFKLLFIVILVLVLLIPDAFIYDAIDSREGRQRSTVNEISKQWSKPQTVIGPILIIPYHKSQVKKDSIGFVTVLPSDMRFDASLKSRPLRRGIYESVVYNSDVEIDGTFDLSTLKPTDVPLSALIMNQAKLQLCLSDLRGIETISGFRLGNKEYELSGARGAGSTEVEYVGDYDEKVYEEVEVVTLEPDDSYGMGSYLYAKVDLDSLVGRRDIAYSCSMSLKGSKAMSVAPVGKSSTVKISGDWNSPSFSGMFLPSERSVEDTRFDAVWNLNSINRDYAQVSTANNMSEIKKSVVTADLYMPVDRYQKTERAVKYAVLVIILTFISVLFAETMLKHKIYVFQYLLIGLALVLFYSLLLSLAEHMAFGYSYLIAAVMTIGLVGLYMYGILHSAKVSGCISALLALIYGYIFVLLQLETFALLAGSLGLFVALAAIMYASLRLDWKAI